MGVGVTVRVECIVVSGVCLGGQGGGGAGERPSGWGSSPEDSQLTIEDITRTKSHRARRH